MNQVKTSSATGDTTVARQPRLTFAQAVLEAIRTEMQADSSIFYLGQDVGTFGGVMQGTQGLLEEFGPQRILETPISESSMTGLGLGASLLGCKPIVELSFGEFLPAAMNQLINQAPNLHYLSAGAVTPRAVIRTRMGDGPYGGHPQDYSVWFCHTPGIKVVMPATPSDAYGLMRAAIHDPAPVLFIESMSLSHGRREVVDLDAPALPIGPAAVARHGKDLTLVAYGSQLPPALRAADKAAEQGIDVEVIDLRSLLPWDEDTVIGSVRKTGRLLTVHEAWKAFGHGAEVIARVLEVLGPENRPVQVARVGARPIPIPTGPLRKLVLPSLDDILAAILGCTSAGTAARHA